MKHDNVIVIGGAICALGIVRALGKYGIKSTILSYNKNDIAHTSKYVDSFICIPDPQIQEKEFIEKLIDLGSKYRKALLIPTTDEVLIATSKHKQLLSKYYTVSTLDEKHLKIFIAKKYTYELCANLKIPYPKTYMPKNLAELEKIQIRFPCIVKPVQSHIFMRQFHTKLIRIRTDDELKKIFGLCKAKGQEVMIQEWIRGNDSHMFTNIIYIDQQGRIQASAVFQKTRQNPPRTGVVRVARTYPHNMPFVKYSNKIIKHLGLKGIFEFEYKKDLRTDTLKLIEINPRFCRYNWLYTVAGVNIPYMMYHDLINKKPIPSQKAYRTNVYFIDVYADVINYIFRDRKELWTLRDYIAPYRKDKTFAVFAKDDPKPFLYQFLILPFKYFRMVRDMLQ